MEQHAKQQIILQSVSLNNIKNWHYNTTFCLVVSDN